MDAEKGGVHAESVSAVSHSFEQPLVGVGLEDAVHGGVVRFRCLGEDAGAVDVAFERGECLLDAEDALGVAGSTGWRGAGGRWSWCSAGHGCLSVSIAAGFGRGWSVGASESLPRWVREARVWWASAARARG